MKAALKFQILTTFTAFLCVIKEKDQSNPSNILKKVEIASIESHDYFQEEEEQKEKEYEEVDVDMGGLFSLDDVQYVQKSKPKLVKEAFPKFVKEVKKFRVDKEYEEESAILMKIVLKQKVGGYWAADLDLISLMGLDAEKFFEEIPQEIKSKEIWLTIAIIYLFHVKFKSTQGSWKLISQKAEEYLEENQVSYQKYQEKVSLMLK